MRKQGKWLVVLFLIALTLSACNTGAPKPETGSAGSSAGTGGEASPSSQPSASAKPIKIGYISPMTGRAATYGQLQKIAVDIAVEKVNASGGINGSPIEIVLADDQFDPQQSVSVYRKLAIEDDVFAILGPYSSASWENVVPLANQMEVPTINMTSVKPGITKLPWAIRIHASDDKLIPDGVKQFREKYPNVKKVVIIGDVKESSGLSGMEEYKKAAAAQGLTVAGTVEYQTGQTDFSPVVTKIKSLNPDAIFVSSVLVETLGVAKEIERQGLDVPIVVNALSLPFATVAGSAGKNWHVIGFFANEQDGSNPVATEFAKEFLERSKSINGVQQPPTIGSNSVAYDGIMMLANVLKSENITADTPVKEAREKIQKGLVAIKDYQGVNQISMLPNGDALIRTLLMKLDVDKKIWVEMK